LTTKIGILSTTAKVILGLPQRRRTEGETNNE